MSLESGGHVMSPRASRYAPAEITQLCHTTIILQSITLLFEEHLSL